MQWIIENDNEAELIARRGALWMHDLLFHDDSEDENELIEDEILERYYRQFSR